MSELPVALDAMGGDHAPGEIVAGAVAAVRDLGVSVILVGRAPRIKQLLSEHEAARDVPIVHAEDTLAMQEGALASWRRPRSSVAVAAQLVRRGQASALVSAGSTGGVVVTSRLRLRGQPGIMRPAIAVALPTGEHPTVLLDAGATADPKPEMLVQFAALGAAYARLRGGIEVPRVGLLTIGAEPGKGNKLARKAHELLTGAADPGYRFAGNIEGNELLNGDVDVVVTDGFTGNVALKTIEGAVRVTFNETKAALTATRRARLGARLQGAKLRELRNRLDSETYGGGVLLGLNGTVVIAHGASRAPAIAAACGLARDLVNAKVAEQIGASIPRPHRFGRREQPPDDAAEPDSPPL